MTRRIVIFTELNKAVVALETTTQFDIVYDVEMPVVLGATMERQEYDPLYVVPSDRMVCAELMAEVTARAMNCPVSWGRE
jgi:hypothetical protein